MESKEIFFNCHNLGIFFLNVCGLLEEASLVGFNFRGEMHPPCLCHPCPQSDMLFETVAPND